MLFVVRLRIHLQVQALFVASPRSPARGAARQRPPPPSPPSTCAPRPGHPLPWPEVQDGAGPQCFLGMASADSGDVGELSTSGPVEVWKCRHLYVCLGTPVALDFGLLIRAVQELLFVLGLCTYTNTMYVISGFKTELQYSIS